VVHLVKMAGDLPSNSPLDVLAAATIPDAQVKSGDVTLVASFATTRLTQSTVYAVVVSRTTATTITGRAHQGGDDCTGDLFIGDVREGFLKPLDLVMDMIVTVLVL
jgi:hypothetical protein